MMRGKPINEELSLADSLRGLAYADLEGISADIEEIRRCYQAAARKVGMLYLRADTGGLAALTAQLDQPMRKASENDQTFAAVLEIIRASSRHQRDAKVIDLYRDKPAQ